MIALFTDYGPGGPYLGQVQAVLHALAPGVPVVTLMADVPRQNPKAAAYLLPAYAASLPAGTIFLCVVDPGVGTGADPPILLRADDACYVGPDNGQFDLLLRRSRWAEIGRILWRPEQLSATFHGRDLYAPVCARLALGGEVDVERASRPDTRGWPDDLWEVVYVDHFGNTVIGARADTVRGRAPLNAGGRLIPYAETFGSVAEGSPFWYGNSSGLVEIAVNRGSAADSLGLSVGDAVAPPEE